MRQVNKFFVCSAAGLLLTGCTVAPDVDMTYVTPKARTLVTVTQTIGCSKSNYILSVASGTIATSYVPDYDGPRGKLNFHAPDSWFADTDTAVSLLDDGRLSSINANYVGEGAAVVKSVVALAGTFVGGNRIAIVPGPKPDFCTKLALHALAKPAGGGAGGDAPPTVTLTYTNQFDYVQQSGAPPELIDQFGKSSPLTVPPGGTIATVTLDLPPDANSSPIVHDLSADQLAFTLIASTGGRGPNQPLAIKTTDLSDSNVVEVPTLSLLNFALEGPVGDLTKSVITNTTQAVVPTRDLVAIPIGKSEPFGKIATTLTVAGSGLVTKLEYNKGSGAADLVTAASQIAAQAEPQSPAQKAADVQGQADLIYEQHRLIVCQASPANCPSK